MKKVLFIVLVLVFNAAAQYESSFVTTPFGIAGGFFAGVNFTNADDINLMLQNNNFPTVQKNIVTTGGGGFAYLPWVSNLRVGGMGFSGRTSEKNSTGKEVIYSIGGGGLTVDYTLPFSRTVLISIGTTIGAGSVNLEMYNNSGSFNWNNPDVSGVTGTVAKRITNSYLMLIPALNVDIPIMRFIDVKFGAAYHLALLDKWTVDNGADLMNAPKTPASGLMLNAGLYIGVFF